jgi:hypothetical protein
VPHLGHIGPDAHVEQRLDEDQRAISAIVERLARIEERANAQLELLRRIDGRLQERRQ